MDKKNEAIEIGVSITEYLNKALDEMIPLLSDALKIFKSITVDEDESNPSENE